MIDFYIGQVGIDPDKFWSYTWKENHLLGESYLIQQNLDWERTRFISSMIYNVNCTKKSQMIPPDKLFSLPQDVYLERGKPKSTPEDFKAFREKVSKMKFEDID